MRWYMAALKNYRGFRGRARRAEYWNFVLFHALANVLLFLLAVGVMLTGAATQSGSDPVWPWAIAAFTPPLAYYLGTLLPAIAVAVRRLHDTGRSGWWYFLGLVPYVGPVVLIVFYAMDGEPRENRYGPSPKPVPFFVMEHPHFSGQVAG